MSQDLDTQHFGHPSEPGVPGHQQWLRDEKARKKIRSAAAEKYAEWESALAFKLEVDDTDEWPQAHKWEQDAYDRLVDFVESNGLNWSEYDPRPDDEEDA